MTTHAQFQARPIAAYLHCRKCLAEGRGNDIAAGLHQDGESIVIWCNRHEMGVGKFALANPPRLECEACGDTEH